MRRVFVRSAFFLLLTLVATAAFTDAFAFYDSYYSDASFTTQVGEHDKECDGTVSANWGTTSDYRVRISIRCSDSLYTKQCQEFENGAWVTIACP